MFPASRHPARLATPRAVLLRHRPLCGTPDGPRDLGNPRSGELGGSLCGTPGDTRNPGELPDAGIQTDLGVGGSLRRAMSAAVSRPVATASDLAPPIRAASTSRGESAM